MTAEPNKQTLPDEVDVIVVGGGSAGCVVAGRLAQASPELSIALIEHGINNDKVIESHQPGYYSRHIAPTSTNATFYQTVPDDKTNGRAVVVAAGGLLGGGSSINFQLYTRASASDYDDWNTEGWAFKDLLPLACKTETNTLQDQDWEVHGRNGPLGVSYGGSESALGEEWIRAAAECWPELPFTYDAQDFKTGHAVSKSGKWIDQKGHRSDAAHGFIHPILESYPNLKLITEHKTIRVVFDESGDEPRAISVEVCFNPLARNAMDPENPPKVKRRKIIKAKKYVVLSAGALSTPAILERSGVGKAGVLKEAGVDKVVSELNGVGENYNDHQLASAIYVFADEADTLCELLRGTPEVVEAESALWANGGAGRIATNGIDAAVKLRPTDQEAKKMGPDFQKRWEDKLRDAKDKTVMSGMSLDSMDKYAMICQFDNHRGDKSRGSVHINSSDPFAMPTFDAAFLRDPADLPVHVWAYKRLREIIRRMPSYRGEFAPTSPAFPEGEARCLSKEEAAKLVGKKLDDIAYTAEDDKAIEDWVRNNIGSTWHSMSTCSMKPRDQDGVVDARLNVYGTKGLKVCDLSIAPSNLGTNTYSVSAIPEDTPDETTLIGLETLLFAQAALTIGEKGAVLLGEDLGIKV
ncbi:BQ5605_C027g10337 [Microbotryum silenes-dioicae]|uniref:BQ5605_C027g10337 protein n=1 Tax=Microbotryum silenes-dioicae TaxID=796604 RepID=A0A2X0MQX8_9BASI|nr:BQ5605_C027g10337 [Microbotryum silenes-dioicae]